MRVLLPVAMIGLLGASLSGCIAYDVASAGVGLATTVVTTTADVAGSVAKGAVHAVSGSDDEDKDGDSSHRHHHHSDDDDN